MYQKSIEKINGYLSGKTFLALIISLIIVSCQKKYEVYRENNQEITQLLSIDKKEKRAYFVDLLETHSKTSIEDVLEKIVNFYKLEDYYLTFYRKMDVDIAKYLKQDYKNYMAEYNFVPYEYRNEYVTEKGDTIAKFLWRDGTHGHLYTPQKYTSKDTLLLSDIFKYLGLTSCFLYDKPITIRLESHMDSYSKYDLNDGFLFLDEVHSGVFFSIDSVTIKKDKETDLYRRYITNKCLSHEQALEVINRNKLSEKQNIVNFYLPYEKQDYASIQYSSNNNTYIFYMFNEKKTYEYDINSKKWTYSYDHKEDD